MQTVGKMIVTCCGYGVRKSLVGTAQSRLLSQWWHCSRGHTWLCIVIYEVGVLVASFRVRPEMLLALHRLALSVKNRLAPSVGWDRVRNHKCPG
jgi:hypothetical protein